MSSLLIRLRKEDELSRSDLGKLVGEDQRTISKYELEDGELPVSVVKRIAEMLGVG